MADIFISYSREDRPRIEKLAAALEAKGFSVWWDKNLTGGTEFSKETEGQLKSAGVVIVAWSKTSVDSYWVADEATVARDKGNFLPIAIDAVEPKIGFRQFQTIAFDRWQGEASAPEFVELASVARARLGGAPAVVGRPVKASWMDKLRRPRALAAIGAGVLALIALVFIASRMTPSAVETAASMPSQNEGSSEGTPQPDEASARSADAASKDASIAVLPFADLSPERDQQYFSDGIAEEILNALVHVDGMKVASRTSSFRFRDPTVGVPAIARELGVRHILEGSVRKAGDGVRVTAQLIDASSDRHLWSETYDRPLTTESAFAIQEDIANAVVRELEGEMGVGAAGPHAVSLKADTENVEAYELYLMGRALFMKRGRANLIEAMSVLERATAIDPAFARGWEQLASVYVIAESWSITDRKYLRLALDAAETALRLNPDLSMPYAVRGEVILNRISDGEPGDWGKALDNLNEAVARDPKNATAWFWRGQHLLVLGFLDRAVQDFSRCREIDPAYNYCVQLLALTHLLAEREEEAFRVFDSGFDYVDASSIPLFAISHAARGDYDAASALIAKIYSNAPQVASVLIRKLTDRGFSEADRLKALALLDRAELPSERQAQARFILGDFDRIPANIDSMIWWSRSDEAYSTSAARKELMRRFRLPDYWRAHGFPPQCRPVGPQTAEGGDFECD